MDSTHSKKGVKHASEHGIVGGAQGHGKDPPKSQSLKRSSGIDFSKMED
jgi:hypothetical protein